MGVTHDICSADFGRELLRIWDDQAAFNQLLRPVPEDEKERAKQIRDFTLFTTNELHELLGTMAWKAHRNSPSVVNRAHQFEEGVDVFKCVLSMLQILGMTPRGLVDSYWSKSAVVRQRYQEEWMLRLDRACVVVDIDNVLCDYVSGICDWVRMRYAVPSSLLDELKSSRAYVSAETLNIKADTWQRMKHEFRTGGFKRTLPLMPGAREFLTQLKARGLQVVLLTSRPIDEYPNLLTDTVMWLNSNQLPFDYLWWGMDKAERIVRTDGLSQHVQFIVDDEPRFIDQFSRAGFNCFWYRPNPADGRGLHDTTRRDKVTEVHSLRHILDATVSSQEVTRGV